MVLVATGCAATVMLMGNHYDGSSRCLEAARRSVLVPVDGGGWDYRYPFLGISRLRAILSVMMGHMTVMMMPAAPAARPTVLLGVNG